MLESLVKFVGGSVLVVGIIALIIAALIFAPMFTIWSLNVLFGFGIEITWATWASALWINWVLMTKINRSKN